VTSRVGNDALWQQLSAREAEWESNGIKSIKLIGDAESPAPIAWATYAGHRYARELDMPDIGDALPFKREVAALKP
ncbi:MAG: dimethylamine/trimethylamine dehydrogenase, partial [Candidatus Azotimanducaceae bacterium]